ncbi:CD1871A family CXXC motif-containing protein [Desulfogranum japonicum]|uniref:CD1871A family CXXC motif-containing protein n=1 Tax=Desulfogranum japonicum TaxID=231447 RepID=UPI000420429E
MGSATYRHKLTAKKEKPSLRKMPLFLIFFFLLLWLIGIGTGEPGRVLEQAKSICLECIGIG